MRNQELDLHSAIAVLVVKAGRSGETIQARVAARALAAKFPAGGLTEAQIAAEIARIAKDGNVPCDAG